MFEEFYKLSPDARERHIGGPALEERVRFLSHLQDHGYARSSIKFRAAVLLVIAEDTDLLSRESVSENEVAQQVLRSVNNKKREVENKEARYKALFWIAVRCLIFLNKLEVKIPKMESIQQSELSVFARYVDFLKDEKGATEKTMVGKKWVVTDFLYWLNTSDIRLQDLTIAAVDRYVQSKKSKWCRQTLSGVISKLRSFCDFCEVNSFYKAKVSSALQAPRVYRMEQLPAGPPWKSVQKLLKAPDLRTHDGIRSRAILLLLAVYGLRSAEVVALKLEDINWSNDTIKVVRAKTRLNQTFPLTKEVGEAIALYLKKVRPRETSYREIFLRFQVPVAPLKPSGLGNITKRYCKTAGISPLRGPHSLRHACASNLMSNQVSLKEIADHLGHGSLQSTRIYAKVDLHGLRQVADFDMGVLQ